MRFPLSLMLLGVVVCGCSAVTQPVGTSSAPRLLRAGPDIFTPSVESDVPPSLWKPVDIGASFVFPMDSYWEDDVIIAPEVAFVLHRGASYDWRLSATYLDMKQLGTPFQVQVNPITLSVRKQSLMGSGFAHMTLGASWFLATESDSPSVPGFGAGIGFTGPLTNRLWLTLEGKYYWAVSEPDWMPEGQDLDFSVAGVCLSILCNL